MYFAAAKLPLHYRLRGASRPLMFFDKYVAELVIVRYALPVCGRTSKICGLQIPVPITCCFCHNFTMSTMFSLAYISLAYVD